MPKLITPGQWVQIDWTCEKCAVPMLATGTVFAGGLHEHQCPKCRRKAKLAHAYPYHEFVPSDGRLPFLARCVRGEVKPSAIDDYIDEWHRGSSGKGLYEFLGMTKQEYFEWVKDDKALKRIIQQHQNERAQVG